MKTKKCSKGFTLVELLVVIAIIGILAGIVLVSLQSAKNKAKLASFRSTAVSINPAAMTCADESSLNITDEGPTTAICADATVIADVYPTLQAGVCDGTPPNNYTVVATDPAASAADGQYGFTVSCNIATVAHTVVCSETGCTP